MRPFSPWSVWDSTHEFVLINFRFIVGMWDYRVITCEKYSENLIFLAPPAPASLPYTPKNVCLSGVATTEWMIPMLFLCLMFPGHAVIPSSHRLYTRWTRMFYGRTSRPFVLMRNDDCLIEVVTWKLKFVNL